MVQCLPSHGDTRTVISSEWRHVSHLSLQYIYINNSDCAQFTELFGGLCNRMVLVGNGIRYAVNLIRFQGVNHELKAQWSRFDVFWLHCYYVIS